MGRDPIIRQAVPGRKNQHLDLRHEKTQRGQKLIYPRIVSANMEQIWHKAAGHKAAQDLGVMTFGGTMDQDFARSGQQRMKWGQRPRP